MKNLFFVLCLMFLSVLLLFPRGEGEETLRLRVIGKSDEARAQEEKMEVARVLSRLLEKERFDTVWEAQEWIENNLDVIENVSKKTLEKLGAEDAVRAELKCEYYEEEDIFEKSLVVTLGKGEGHNFFTTLFPRLTEEFSRVQKGSKKAYSFTFFKGDRLIEGRLLFFDLLHFGFH